jgi:hypothetical protein
MSAGWDNAANLWIHEHIQVLNQNTVSTPNSDTEGMAWSSDKTGTTIYLTMYIVWVLVLFKVHREERLGGGDLILPPRASSSPPI